MHLLQELLQINERDLLLEYLGNLDFIDKKFLSGLKTSYSRRYSRGDHDYSKQKMFPSELGQKSEIHNVSFKNPTDLERIVKQLDFRVGTINSSHGQLALIKMSIFGQTGLSDDKTSWDPDLVKYLLVIDTDITKSLATPENETEIKELASKSNFMSIKGASNVSWDAQDDLISFSKMYSNLGNLLKICKILGISDLSFTYATEDVQRKETHKQRMGARGELYTTQDEYVKHERKMPLQLEPGKTQPMPEDKFKIAVKSALMKRLEVFKQSKALNVKDASELLQVMKEKGILDHINIDRSSI